MSAPDQHEPQDQLQKALDKLLRSFPPAPAKLDEALRIFSIIVSMDCPPCS